MVEQSILNNVFRSLADPTRRDILGRVYERQQTITELARKYKLSFAAVAKHISVLEGAGLVVKSRSGKEQIVAINGQRFEVASDYLLQYAQAWSDRLDRMEDTIKKESRDE